MSLIDNVIEKLSDAQRVLCQDCLAVAPYSDARHLGEERCNCGGEFCGCSGCQHTIGLLREGVLDASRLHITGGDLTGWSESAGIQR